MNRWRGSANYRRSFSRAPDLLVSQNPKVVPTQPGRSLIGQFRRSSSTSESESIDKFKSQLLLRAHWSVSFRKLFGYNQLVISLADLQVHLNRWRGSANYKSSMLAARVLLVSQNPDFVGAQPAHDFIGWFLATGRFYWLICCTCHGL